MDNINDRIIKKTKELGLKQRDLVTGTKASKATVSKWFNHAASPSGSHLVKIAKILKTTEKWLVDGKGSSESNIEPFETQPNNEVPIIDMVAAGTWTEPADPYPMGTGMESIVCPYPHSEFTFAVVVRGDSMLDEFPEGLIIFIDPNVAPENKDYCVAKLTDTNEATFKQYVIEDGHQYLKAINPSWPNKYLPINGNCHIVGKMIGVYKKY